MTENAVIEVETEQQVIEQEELFREDEPFEDVAEVQKAPVVKEPPKKVTPPVNVSAPEQTPPPQQQTVQQEPVKEEKAAEPKPEPEIVKEVYNSKTLYKTYNTDPVEGEATVKNKVKFSKAFVVTRIITFHYNDGKGAVAGTISMEGRKGASRAWQARNAPGADGKPMGRWICEPNERLEAGNYVLTVSDEKSWSTNSKAGKKGMVIIEGYEAD